MNLDNVLPLPLNYTEYVRTSAKLLLDNDDISQKQLLVHMQSVCIVCACLAVKRNAGIVGTDAKRAAAAEGYEQIAVPRAHLSLPSVISRFLKQHNNSSTVQ